ncbi:cytochrome c oxidase subunit I [Desulfovibrio caledoniensis]
MATDAVSPGFMAPGGKSWVREWLFTLDHKRIGMLYLWCITAFFAVGVLLGLVIRLELFWPGKDFIGQQAYNAIFTLHGVIMIFIVVIPSIPAAFGNLFLPLQLGAEDVAFPRLNTFSFWLYAIGGATALISLFTGGGAPDTGWTFYVPFSAVTTTNVSVAVAGVFILGFSSILTGLNFIVTIHRLRAPGLTWTRLTLFAWALYATAWIQVLATPILSITVLLIIVERLLGLGIFDPARGGDPILYQHLFWIYSHPAVYIMILPAMGVISDIIPVFCRKSIFGYKTIVGSSLAIAFAGSLVWAHHMFVSGMSDTAVMVFSLLTFIVAVPSAVKVFNWLSTMYKGSIRLEPPLIYALGFIFLFAMGGITGLVLGSAGTDMHVHDTYFVVGHFHYVIFGGTGFGMFAAIHYWFPKMYGRMYNRKQAIVAALILVVGLNGLYFPMYLLGLEGMPRRYYDYLPQFTSLHQLSTYGSWITFAGLGLMFWNLIRSRYRGEPAGRNPWKAATLEWTLPSPPPTHNFDTEPVVTHGPYDFSKVRDDDGA